MSLPRPPISANTPIPNQPFAADEVYYLEGNQGRLPLGNGLYIDPASGEFTDVNPDPYIYCTPQFGNLPVSYPPYGCETEVNTAVVSDFSSAWQECMSIETFPCLDTSSGTDFTDAWFLCDSLTSFPLLDVSSGTNFLAAWAYTAITHFPVLDVSSGINFGSTWEGCGNLVSFPPLDVSSGTIFASAWEDCSSLTSFPPLDFSLGENFEYTWRGCSSLTTFPAGILDSCLATSFSSAWANCALSQTSVDNILVSLNTAGQSNGIVNIDGGTSAAPSATGLAAKVALQGRGWTVLTN